VTSAVLLAAAWLIVVASAAVLPVALPSHIVGGRVGSRVHVHPVPLAMIALRAFCDLSATVSPSCKELIALATTSPTLMRRASTVVVINARKCKAAVPSLTALENAGSRADVTRKALATIALREQQRLHRLHRPHRLDPPLPKFLACTAAMI
jgi:hypothetical protein